MEFTAKERILITLALSKYLESLVQTGQGNQAFLESEYYTQILDETQGLIGKISSPLITGNK